MRAVPTTDLVSRIREAGQLTQERLARQLGVSFATVNAWERGRSEPRAYHRASLERLADSLGIEQGFTALVIDDDEDAALLIETLLPYVIETATIAVATSGADGLLMCGAMKPDLVFLDLKMPGIDGFEVVSALQRVDGLERTQVILVTGQFDQGIEARASDSGVAEILPKPYTPDQFKVCVNQVLARREDRERRTPA